MDPVLGAALIASIPVAVVAVAGTLAQIWGPAWREGQVRREEVARAAEDARYSRAMSFIKVLTKPLTYAGLSYSMDDTSLTAVKRNTALERWRMDANMSRMKLLATLRPGEKGFAAYTARAIEDSMQIVTFSRADTIRTISETVFAYLRGELSDREVAQLSPRRQLLEFPGLED